VSFGQPHLHLRRTESTNDRARELAEAGAPSGMIVTADSQSAGRGRHGRRWSAPPGTALLYSAILSPLDERHALLPLAVPLAVCDAIESLAPVECRVKWPNDVWIAERKAAGVLIEARPPDWAVIGVGVNLAIGDDEFPDELRWPATSVGHGAEPDAARTALDAALGEWTTAPAGTVLEEFARRDALRGREVSWSEAAQTAAGSGTAAGVDERGYLLVETPDGPVALGAGEVSLRIHPR
jgi:BirA family transcriptional regulator, biotin operon repressor / biotin---[acetyl-CoA-carboxylase] ligase